MLDEENKSRVFTFGIKDTYYLEPVFSEEEFQAYIEKFYKVSLLILGNESSLIAINTLADYVGYRLDYKVEYEWEFLQSDSVKPDELICWVNDLRLEKNSDNPRRD